MDKIWAEQLKETMSHPITFKGRHLQGFVETEVNKQNNQFECWALTSPSTYPKHAKQLKTDDDSQTPYYLWLSYSLNLRARAAYAP